MKKIFLPVLIALALAFGSFYYISSSEEENENDNKIEINNQNTATENQNNEKNEESGIKNEEHRNSILTLIEKEYEGNDFKVGQVLTEEANYTRHFITYQSEGLTISGIMNIPDGEGSFPVLILNHGYIDPDIYTNGRGLKREQDYFARNGFVVIHPDYRGHAQSDPDPESGDEQGMAYSGYTTDVINAIVSLKKADLDYVNPEKIGMLGHSMGGGVSMNALIAKPNLIDAGILYAPVSSDYQKNFERWRKDELTEKEKGVMENEIGDLEKKENFFAFSSATYFERIEAPIMIHQGTADKDVPTQWSIETKNKLEKNNKEVTYHEYPGAPHEFATAWPTFMQRSLDFFQENLE